MSERFYADDKAVRGRAGIFDSAKGNRLVAFFLNDPTNAEAAPAMAKVCARALNAAVSKPVQRKLTDG
ncbi:MAG TPA: hypothetical protein PKC79_02195 [Solidesulfovibrio magneticus]|nr:hypothetical protein [Solidesulfovibrio magneticus]